MRSLVRQPAMKGFVQRVPPQCGPGGWSSSPRSPAGGRPSARHRRQLGLRLLTAQLSGAAHWDGRFELNCLQTRVAAPRRHVLPSCQPPRHTRTGSAQKRTGVACSRSATGCWQAVAATGNKGWSHSPSGTDAAGRAACCRTKAASACTGDTTCKSWSQSSLAQECIARCTHWQSS